MRLLLVYGHEPSGHASAAKALESCARARGLDVLRVNISGDYHPVLGPAIAKAYLKFIQNFPALWGALHENKALAEIAQNWRRLYRTLEGGKLKATLEELRPDLIVCTHAPPFGALALEKEKGGLSCPLVGVVTDFHAHPYWIPGGDLYLVPTAEAKKELVSRGIGERCVLDAGIPIDPLFAAPLKAGPARRALGLSSEGPVLLLCGGSRGLGRLEELAARLLKRLPRTRLLIACGSNEALAQSLRTRLRRSRRARVFFAVETPRMRELMAASDLLIGKAGGVTSAEALALGLPMLFFEPIPGQEECNARFLVERGAAIQAGRLEEVSRLVSRALARGLGPLRRAAKALGRPASASAGLEAVLGLRRAPLAALR